LAWSEVKPKYLDYEYCQILLIGERLEQGVQPTKKDQKHDKETPQEELEKLEHEDELRVQHLHGKLAPVYGYGYLQRSRTCVGYFTVHRSSLDIIILYNVC
jgi:hypothetical protein